MEPSFGQDARPRGDPNMVALLSLKLLLLGLFILLNALSEYEQDRARRVIDSVNEAFNGQVQAARSHADHAAGLGALEEAATSLDTAGQLFEQVAPVVRRETTREGERLWLELPASTLFRSGDVVLRSGRQHLLSRFAEALAVNRGRAAIQVELLHGTARDAYGALAAAGPRALEPRRAGTLARHLTRLGLDPAWLSVGLLPGAPGRLRLVVTLSENPAGPKRDGEGAP